MCVPRKTPKAKKPAHHPRPRPRRRRRRRPRRERPCQPAPAPPVQRRRRHRTLRRRPRRPPRAGIQRFNHPRRPSWCATSRSGTGRAGRSPGAGARRQVSPLCSAARGSRTSIRRCPEGVLEDGRALRRSAWRRPRPRLVRAGAGAGAVAPKRRGPPSKAKGADHRRRVRRRR